MQIQLLQTQLDTFLANQTGISAAIRIGSAGRGQLGPNSDLDYQLILENGNTSSDVLEAARQHFGGLLRHTIHPAAGDKISLFFGDRLLLCELLIYQEKEDLDKYFLGSEISEVRPAIVADHTGTLADYLQQRASTWQNSRETRLKNEVLRLINEFELRFEACSRAHVRSDGYKFSVLFSHALNAVVRLVWLALGETQFDFMPPNFLTKYSHPLQLGLDKLGHIDLRTAHFQKTHLLQLYTEWAPKAAGRFGLEINFAERLIFLKRILVRDRFWNLRDASKFNPRLRPGLLFRSAAFCHVNPPEDAAAFLDANDIRTVIDLRADRELVEVPYTNEHLGKARHFHTPFDPWEQSDEFRAAHRHLTDHSVIAYHFFLKECRKSVQAVFDLLAENEEPALIHCHAGKDRTGIIFTLLHLLSGAEQWAICNDYYASEMDTRPELLDIVLDEITQQGGVEAYLKTCGITDLQIQKIRQRLCMPPTN